MTLANLINGLLILQNHDEEGEIDRGSEGFSFFVSLRTPLSPEDAARMKEMGWFRGGFPGEGWYAWV